MNSRELDIDKVKVEKLIEKEGEYTNEQGQTFKYRNYTLKFTLSGYPLIFEAKIDNKLKKYIPIAEEYNA